MDVIVGLEIVPGWVQLFEVHPKRDELLLMPVRKVEIPGDEGPNFVYLRDARGQLVVLNYEVTSVTRGGETVTSLYGAADGWYELLPGGDTQENRIKSLMTELRWNVGSPTYSVDGLKAWEFFHAETSLDFHMALKKR